MKGSRVVHWLQLLALTGAAQVAVQAIGFVAGILVIRMLPVHEYALYTLANTMLGAMAILADGGISAGVMAEGGKVWKDKSRLGAVFATGMVLRRKFAVFSLLVAVPALYFLLLKHDASWLMSTMIVLSLLPAFFSALSGKLLEIPALLNQEIKALQWYQVQANIGRLALTALTIFVFPFAAVVIFCSSAGQIWNNWKLKQLVKRLVDTDVSPDVGVHDEILRMVRGVLPSSIYYCISGQLALWMISLFGSTAAVAQIGALGRLAAALAVLQSIYTTLLVPRFARLPGNLRAAMPHFFRVQIGLIAVSVALVGVCAAISDVLLKTLGDSYQGLTVALLLSVSSGAVQLVSATTHGMLLSRGLVVPPQVFIPLIILTQAVIIILVRPTDVNSALLLGLLTAVGIYIIRISYLLWTLKKQICDPEKN